MKSSAAVSVLLTLPVIRALTLPRSQHDNMLARNFKNVLQEDGTPIPTPHLRRRSPQGPASNPGEFTNVGLSAVNPQNHDLNTGSSGSGSGSGHSDYIPDPLPDSQVPDPPLDAGPFSTPNSEAAYTTGASGFFGIGPTGTAASTGFLPRPTGDSNSSRYDLNSTELWVPIYDIEPSGEGESEGPPEIELEGVLEVDIDVEPDGDVVIEDQTLWTHNSTGWNGTNIPLPSGTAVIGTLVPYPVATGMNRPIPTGPPGPVGTGTAGMGGEAAGSDNEGAMPGFTGPKGRLSEDEMTRNEIAADGTGMEVAGMEKRRAEGEADVGMKKGVEEKGRRWLSGWI